MNSFLRPFWLLFSCIFTSYTVVASGSNFYVFDNTAYTNVTIGYGTTSINWIPNYVCKPFVSTGGLPTEFEWKEIIVQWNVHPGYPLVLDCEDLYLKSASTVDDHLERLSTLQTWAADVVPEGQIIGWYGLLGNTPSSLYSYYRDLISNYSHTAFFPSAYTFSSDFTTWTETLQSNIEVAKTINSSLPIWPYTWPQYHNSYEFFPVDLWQRELNYLSSDDVDVDGFIVWGGKNHAVCNDTCQAVAQNEPWLNTTRDYLSDLYGLYGGDAKKSGAQTFLGV